jgi:unsaturated rhamnogalacturonyl hydrolase
MAKVIKVLPASMDAERKKLVGYVRDLLDSCLKFQRTDGLYHDVLDDPKSFIETNLAQMLTYTIYRGIQGGWLDSKYRQAADHMRQAVHKKVDAQGYVQGVCGSPQFNSPGTATEGQAFFLFMEAAHRDLKR